MQHYFLFFMTTQTGSHQATVPHLVSVDGTLLPSIDLTVDQPVHALADGAIAWHVAATCFGGQYTTDADDCGIEYDAGMLIAPARGEAPVYLGNQADQHPLVSQCKRAGMNCVTLHATAVGQLCLNEQAYVALSKEPVSEGAKGFTADAKTLWAMLGNTPVNNDGELEEAFLGFDVGTDRETIWHWFEEVFNLSVAKDLMNLS